VVRNCNGIREGNAGDAVALTDLGDWPFWEHLGKVAPIVTALIAFGAASVAVFSLLAQIYSP
jgi:hypothetical protein